MPLPKPIDRYLASCLPELSARTLEIRTDRAIQAARLPLLHRDPFDCCCRRQAVRMLIAQAQVEGMAIVSADRAFDLYDVEILSHD